MVLTKSELAHVHRRAAEMEAQAYFMCFRARDMRNQAADHRTWVRNLRTQVDSGRAASPDVHG